MSKWRSHFFFKKRFWHFQFSIDLREGGAPIWNIPHIGLHLGPFNFCWAKL